jgi:hypothetical protein
LKYALQGQLSAYKPAGYLATFEFQVLGPKTMRATNTNLLYQPMEEHFRGVQRGIASQFLIFVSPKFSTSSTATRLSYREHVALAKTIAALATQEKASIQEAPSFVLPAPQQDEEVCLLALQPSWCSLTQLFFLKNY